MEKSNPPGKGVAFFIGLFFTFMALFSLWALASQVDDIIKASAAPTWPTVEGVVVSSEVTRGCKNLTGYLPSVSYRYTVGNQGYIGQRIAFGAKACRSKDIAERMASAYFEGKAVQVYFDPASPRESVLNVSEMDPGGILVFIFAFVIFGISFFFAYRHIRLFLGSRSV